MDKDYLCKCNMCGTIMRDENPQVDAPMLDVDAIGKPVEQMIQVYENKIPLWACPNCETDSYLTDDISSEEDELGNNGTYDEQVQFQAEINGIGLNLISCCHCDAIFFHKLNAYKVICPSCKQVNATSDCCDFFYEGMPEQE